VGALSTKIQYDAASRASKVSTEHSVKVLDWLATVMASCLDGQPMLSDSFVRMAVLGEQVVSCKKEL